MRKKRKRGKKKEKKRKDERGKRKEKRGKRGKIMSEINSKKLTPPKPPIMPTEDIACSPKTSQEVLWYIAQNIPHLRKWIIANTSADARLLEYISQQGGPDVKHSFNVLFESYDYMRKNIK